jgi:hypothetical protein
VLTLRPLISKGDILRAYNPSKPRSDSAFRRLRREGVVSDGITIRPRSGGRQRGTITAFYALNEDAVIAYRHGDHDLAVKLATQSAKVEKSPAARELAKVASAGFSRADYVITDVDGVYTMIVEAKHRTPLDTLAEHAVADRRRFDKRLHALGARSFLAWLEVVRDDGAELKDENGVRLWMPRTPELLELGSHHAPVLVRSDLMNGVLWTYVQKAYTLRQDDDADIGDDPFGDLRPAMPDNLSELLDVAPLRPLTATGPALRWA